MADLTYINRDEDEANLTKEMSKDVCLKTEPEQEETADLTDVAQIPSKDWQIGCNLNECLLNVYKNDRWTDMTIRCGDKEVSRTLKAHKIILAARSPVFEAMLFGPCSDGKTEYEFPEADVDIFDMMLRFMYNDDANLTCVDEATDLMQMADMYQITSLVDHCAQHLQTNITVSNVCKSLDCALKYSAPTLRDACCDFADRNVQEVMHTDGFLKVSNECLTYILKGDTFFADEDVIFHKAEEWAKSKLSDAGKENNGQNIRLVLCEAFYYLRLPTLPTVKLMECIKRKGYFSLDETEDIVDCNVERQSQLSFSSNVRRVPLEESVTVSSDEVCKKNTNIVHVLEIKIDKDLHIEFIEIPWIRTFMKYSSSNVYRREYNSYKGPIEGQDLPNSFNPLLSVAVTIDKINFENSFNIHQLSNESSKIVFEKPVLLKKRESPFDLKIQVEPFCKDPNVLLFGIYGTVRTSSSSNVISVSQTQASMIGINAIGIRNCSFRGKTEDLGKESEWSHLKSEDLDRKSQAFSD